MSTARILVVEDEGIIAADIQSRLSDLGYEVVGLASSGEEAMQLITGERPDLVLMDIMLNGLMDGIYAAEEIRKRFAIPVVFLTSHADDATLERAKITEPFGYIIKPFEVRELHTNIEMGLYKHRMERERSALLENTLGGAIRVLTEILSMVDPHAFGHGQKLRDYVSTLAHTLKLAPSWEFEVAAMLCRVGFVTIPPTVIQKMHAGITMHRMEGEMIARVPEFGRDLLARIPRLETVASYVHYQNKNFDGTGFPYDSVAGPDIPLGGRIFRILTDMIKLESEGTSKGVIVEIMTRATGKYDPKLLKEAIVCLLVAPPKGSKPVALKDLRVGQLLKEAIQTNDGTQLVTSGNRISALLLNRLQNFTELSGIKEPIYVEE